MSVDTAPSDLPVEDCVPELRRALAAPGGQAVLVAPPGAGKTTIVPLRLLDEPWLAGRRIVMLEPRRLATRAACRRMASLLDGQVVPPVRAWQPVTRRRSRRTWAKIVTAPTRRE